MPRAGLRWLAQRVLVAQVLTDVGLVERDDALRLELAALRRRLGRGAEAERHLRAGGEGGERERPERPRLRRRAGRGTSAMLSTMTPWYCGVSSVILPRPCAGGAATAQAGARSEAGTRRGAPP